MKAAGTAAAITGFSGVGAASGVQDDCTCEAGTTQCFPEEEQDTNCSYCKISLSVGESCTIPDTNIEITRESGRCISYSDPDGAISDIALKAGNFCECTYLSEVELNEDDQLCTTTSEGEDCQNDISHITVEYNCNGEPPEECEYTADMTRVDSFCCDGVMVCVDDVEQGSLTCPVTAKLSLESPKGTNACTTSSMEHTFEESGCYTFDLSDLCCNPTEVTFYDDNENVIETCTPDESLDCRCVCENKFCKVEGIPEAGESYCDGAITVTNVTQNGSCFSFTSTVDICRVFVKGGGGPDAGETYEFPCGTREASELCANVNPGGQLSQISHIDFYVCEDRSNECSSVNCS
ncbi:hypothetical protein SAMN04487948_11318 [Halogranum amylolyticum]|uniref:Uncharacterized protein n=2 Tax=Halogranum amylolyticum TaxID=660520 RepID=A0A1H8UX55_9EURY|nr:hypothetical protein SAMN04487948_11318 [Halogranum amylolyticum]